MHLALPAAGPCGSSTANGDSSCPASHTRTNPMHALARCHAARLRTPGAAALCWLKRRHRRLWLPHVPHPHGAVAAAGRDLRRPVPARAAAEAVDCVDNRRVRLGVKHGRRGGAQVPNLQPAAEGARRELLGAGGGRAKGGALEAVALLHLLRQPQLWAC